jgi:tetratricopeptide (TPR) repeat protein
MDPLLQAVMHGCKAGRHQDALRDFTDRVMRGDRFYAARQLGLLGPLLSTLSHFFASGDWAKPVTPRPPACQGLDEAGQVYVLNQAALYLQATKGYAAEQARRAAQKAQEICQRTGEVRPTFQALRGQWVYYLLRAELETARLLGEQLAALARKEGEPGMLLESHFALGAPLYYLGEFEASLEQCERGVAIYAQDPARYHANTFFYGLDTGVACLSYSAYALWACGYPDRALNRSREAVRRAREMADDHFSQVLAFYLAAVVHQYRGEGPEARELTSELRDLAGQHGLEMYFTLGTILHGWALTECGQQREGLKLMRDGLGTYRTIESNLSWAYYQLLLAEVCLKTGDRAEGLRAVQEAFDAIQQFGERRCEAEAYRLRGELRRAEGRVEEAEAEDYRRALTTARNQKAKSIELRAATSLGRLLRQRGATAEALQLLGDILGWFKEGLTTKDYREGSELLGQLRGDGPSQTAAK